MADFNGAVAEVCRRMELRPLKPKQLEAVNTFVSGKDTFVALPTGYGKSIIFAVLPMLFDLLLGKELDRIKLQCMTTILCAGVTGSIVIVLSPLISLMIDQKDKFVKKGIQAEFVGKAQENTEAMSAVLNGECQLVYISPESLLCNPKFRNMLLSDIYKKRLRALVVDEAHCVNLWYVIWRVITYLIYIIIFLTGGKTFGKHLRI